MQILTLLVKKIVQHKVAGLFLLILMVSFVGIFDRDLWTPFEHREAEISREFLDHNNWAVPTLNNTPFIEKPPLMYWSAALSLKIFGVHDWAVRVICILLGWGMLFFCYLLGKSLFDKQIGVGALLVMLTTSSFIYRSHSLRSDTGIMFFTLGAVYFLQRAFTGSYLWYIPFYLFVVGAFFSKGLVAFAFLGLFFLAWVILSHSFKEILRARPWIFLPLIAIPIGIWFYFLAQYPNPNGNFLYTYIYENHLHRFLPEPNGSYYTAPAEPVYYYLIGLPEEFIPWIIVVPFMIPWIIANRRNRAVLFLLCWFVPGFIFLSAAGTKGQSYLDPILPALILLIAAWFAAKSRMRWLTGSAIVLSLIFIIGGAFAFPYANTIKSQKTFGQELGKLAGTETPIYCFDPDEATSGAIPFYTGRYFTDLDTEKDLEKLAQTTLTKVVVVVVDKHRDGLRTNTVRKYFPYCRLKDEPKGGRWMYAFSNMEH